MVLLNDGYEFFFGSTMHDPMELKRTITGVDTMNRGSSTLRLLLYSCSDYDDVRHFCYVVIIWL
jgi:hypothetical protein